MEHPPMIGKNIQKLRTARSLTLNVLSERSGVSKAMLSQIESNKVNSPISTLSKVQTSRLEIDLYVFRFRFGCLEKANGS